MTHVISSFNNSSLYNNDCLFFSIEVVTFDGQSIYLEIEAATSEEAQEIAASLVEDADFIMVQGCYAC